MDVNGTGFGIFIGFGGGSDDNNGPKKKKKQKQPRNDFVNGFPNWIPNPEPRTQPVAIAKQPQRDATQQDTFCTPGSSYGSSQPSTHLPTPPASPTPPKKEAPGGAVENQATPPPVEKAEKP